MQKENENSEGLNKNSSEKINYSIKTMEADLKNKGFAKSSFDLSNEKKIVEDKTKDKTEIKEETVQKEVVNPFLKELKPNPDNVYNQSPDKTLKTKKLKGSASKPSSPILEKKSNNKSFLNSKLLIVLLFVSLTAVFAGVYYFYSTQKSNSTLPITETSPEIIQSKTLAIEKKPLPEKLENSKILTLGTEIDLTSLLLGQKVLLSNNTGDYYRIKKDEILLSSTELLALLDIQFPEEILSKLETSWISLYSQENILKISLILKIKEESTEPSSFLENNEYRLPELLKPLFVDETFILQDEPLAFQGSGIIEGIRYYNFTEGASNKSVDWGIANNEYLILTTSKETALELIKDLTIKESSLENSSELEAETLPL